MKSRSEVDREFVRKLVLRKHHVRGGGERDTDTGGSGLCRSPCTKSLYNEQRGKDLD